MRVCWLIAHEKLESNPAEPKLSEAVSNAGFELHLANYDIKNNRYEYPIGMEVVQLV